MRHYVTFIILHPFLIHPSSSVFVPALFSMAEIPALFAQRPIIQRHQKAAMYHPLVEALALTLVDIPFTLATIILFTIITYFIVGLQVSAGQFLYVLFYLGIFLAFSLKFSIVYLASISYLSLRWH